MVSLSFFEIFEIHIDRRGGGERERAAQPLELWVVMGSGAAAGVAHLSSSFVGFRPVNGDEGSEGHEDRSDEGSEGNEGQSNDGSEGHEGQSDESLEEEYEGNEGHEGNQGHEGQEGVRQARAHLGGNADGMGPRFRQLG